MRVIAGTAGGTQLLSPRENVRPTMDRVKAAIFSSLFGVVPGARVLDLFAGTGGLGIEALSRGAASVVFVEKDRAAFEAIQKNLTRTRFQGSQSSVKALDVFSYLDRLAGVEAFDIILADPPYPKEEGDRGFTAELLASESLHRALKSTGVFILEKPPYEPMPKLMGWECSRTKKYGGTEVAMFLKTTTAAPASALAAE